MSRSNTIEFWFDFSSSYAYFAALEIDALAAKHDRSVTWRPFMLGAAFRITGARGLSQTPMKDQYASHDWARLSRLRRVPHALPPHHPSVALPATRAFYFIDTIDSSLAVDFAKAVFDAYFCDGADTADPATVVRIAATAGLQETDVAAAIEDPYFKRAARNHGEQAISRGVFGSPWFFVDDEPFWGWDRLPMVDAWLENGGW